MNPDRNTAERLGEARQRVSDMLAVAAVLGAEIGPEEISRAALVPLPPVGQFFAELLANSARRDLEAVARILAGLGDDRVIARFMADEVDLTKMIPTHRRRRPRPSVAERDQAAAAWLAGPAWELGPEPSPDGGAP